MRTVILQLALICFFASLALAEIIKSGSFQAYSDGINVTLHWVTEDESNVIRLEIERSSGNEGSFVTIGTLDPKGASLYEYIDNSAFRRITSLYQYRIKIVFSNGTNPFYTAPLTVSHTVSGVRRTWGSIKSMFR